MVERTHSCGNRRLSIRPSCVSNRTDLSLWSAVRRLDAPLKCRRDHLALQLGRSRVVVVERVVGYRAPVIKRRGRWALSLARRLPWPSRAR